MPSKKPPSQSEKSSKDSTRKPPRPRIGKPLDRTPEITTRLNRSLGLRPNAFLRAAKKSKTIQKLPRESEIEKMDAAELERVDPEIRRKKYRVPLGAPLPPVKRPPFKSGKSSGEAALGLAFSPERKLAFLEELKVTGNISSAAMVVGVCTQTIDSHREKDPHFNLAFTHALQYYRRTLEAEIHRRAVDGVVKPVYQAGRLVGYQKVYSDALLTLQAKRHIPEYREHTTVSKKTEVDVSINGHLTTEVIASMSDEQREWLRKILESAPATLPAGPVVEGAAEVVGEDPPRVENQTEEDPGIEFDEESGESHEDLT